MDEHTFTGECIKYMGKNKANATAGKKLIVFEGWSLSGTRDLKVNPTEDVEVYYEGDTGELSLADPESVASFMGLSEVITTEVEAEVYTTTEHESNWAFGLRDIPDIYIRNLGKEETFWFPSPSYIFDTELEQLLLANTIDFDPNQFFDGFTVTESDLEKLEGEVCNIMNPVTGTTALFEKETVKDELGDRFYALKPVTV